MFTGLIEKLGRVLSNDATEHGNRLVISSDFKEVQLGESIAVNGVCLTVLSTKDDLHFDVSPETLSLTNLDKLSHNDTVNLERAMLAHTRFGGHYVSGHVDTTALVKSIQYIGDYLQLTLSGFESQSLYYLVPKGSITVEGVSLTINALINQSIELMLVPHTLSNTTLGALQIGQKVNIEFDYLTRVVAHQLKLSNQLKPEVAAC